jgi:hypothetical protein
MKRSLLLTLAIAIAISVVALMGVRSLGGSTDVANAQAPALALDLDGSDGWCTDIDASASVSNGSPHQAAICLLNSATSATDFGITVNYNSGVNTCAAGNSTGKGLDSNPDFVVSPVGGYDCSNSGLTYPSCAAGVAFIGCGTTDNSVALTGPWAIAVISWTASGVGTDNLSFGTTALYNSDGDNLVRCPPAGPSTCSGASVEKVPPPTNTPVPPTNTPLPTSTPLPPTVTPTPPAHPPECDIGELGPIALNPPSLFMKVGDAPAVVDMTDTWKNFGAFTPLGVGATCSVGFAMGAELFGLPTDLPIPAGISVRVEPVGVPIQYGGGDVCLVCNLANPAMVGKPISTCLLGHGPFDSPPSPPATWTYVGTTCDEVLSAYPMSLINHSCENGIDDATSAAGCDWAGYSKACTPAAAPDPLCVDVPALGIQPLVRWTATVGSTHTVSRNIKVQCNAPGVYPLVVFGSSTQAVGAGGAKDPNPANDVSYGLLNVVCAAEMVKDCDPSSAGIQTACNLWLMNPKFPGGTEYGTNPPVILPKADANGCVLPEKGKGCLAVDVWVNAGNGDLDDTNDSDLLPECLGAWEHQVRYDHKIVRFVNNLNPKTIDTSVPPNGTADVSWLESTGRVANCSATILAENWILEGCTTTGTQNGPCGTGIIERMLIIPQTQDLIYRGVFRPTKDNGVVTNVVDDNCEITDIYAEPFANTGAGGLVPVCGNLTITVRMLEGDTDLDCDVDVADDQAIAFRYGSSWGLQLYDQWFDLEPKFADQDIDIKDLQFIFGRNYSTCQKPIPDDQSIPVQPGQPDP